jgi:hypothetical protein
MMEAAAASDSTSLELGGKSLNIVFKDADLSLTVDSYVRGILCALTCSSVTFTVSGYTKATMRR